VPDAVNMVIMARSLMGHNVAIVAARCAARTGFGQPGIRRPVVVRVPPAVAIAMMIRGKTGMAARRAFRPVRQGLG
jgi:hypothetical protein